MMFNFFVNQHLFYALATEDVEPLAEAIRATSDIPRRRSGRSSSATTTSWISAG
jgi:hypothetical protein